MTMLKAFMMIALLAPCHGWGYCNDNDVSCANWAKSGECSKDHVRTLCPHSCSICTHICRDTDASCPAWKDAGECESNMDFMYNSCSVSCGICKVHCYDKDASCPSWARDGECQKNKGLYSLCPVSCGTCTEVCIDKHNDCPSWAADGQCGTNAGYMFKTCPHSCAICDEKSHAASSHPVSDVNMVTPDGRKITERAACADHDRNQCLIWGEHECDANPGAVMKACPAMCGLCTVACEDKYSDCPNWAKGSKNWAGKYSDDACDKDAGFMLPNCPYSCGICPTLHTVPISDKDEM